MASIKDDVERWRSAALQEKTDRIRHRAEALKFIQNGEKTMAREKYVSPSEHIQNIEKSIESIYAQAESQHRELTSVERKKIEELDQHLAELTAVPKPLTVSGARITNRSGGSAFDSFGDFLLAVRSAGIPGGKTDPRLFNAATGLGETVPSDGGFLVNTDFSTQLLEQANAASVLYPRTNRIQISGNSNSIKLPAVDETSRATGSRWGGVQTYWTEEAGEKTASKPKFRQLELSLKKLTGLCYATDELIQDAAVLEKVVSQAFTDEISFVRDDVILRGTGAGQPLGVLNSGCLVTQAAEDGQAVDTVVYQNVVKMFSRMVPRSRRNAIWLINPSVEPQLYQMSLAVGTGGAPVFLPGGSASPVPYATLFGRPLIPCEQCSALGDVGDICFVDLSQYILAEKGGIRTDMSIHVQFVYDESVFRFVYRCDGQPSWASALTPYKGADDLSPFVALAAR